MLGSDLATESCAKCTLCFASSFTQAGMSINDKDKVKEAKEDIL
jgi:hypothetical protein